MITKDWKSEYKKDNEFFNALEEVLDEYFPKMEEETPAKIANKRSEALMLFTQANLLHSKSLSSFTEKVLGELQTIKHWTFKSQYGLEKVDEKTVPREIKEEEYIKVADVLEVITRLNKE